MLEETLNSRPDYNSSPLCDVTLHNRYQTSFWHTASFSTVKALAASIVGSCVTEEIFKQSHINTDTGKSEAAYVPGFGSLIRHLYNKCRSPGDVENNLLSLLLENSKILAQGGEIEYFRFDYELKYIQQIVGDERQADRGQQDFKTQVKNYDTYIFLGIDQQKDLEVKGRGYNQRYAKLELPNMFVNVDSAKPPKACLVDHMLPLAERLMTLNKVLTNSPRLNKDPNNPNHLTPDTNGMYYTNASAEQFVKDVLIPKVVVQGEDVVLTGHSFGGAQVLAVRNAFINMLREEQIDDSKIQEYLNKITFNSIGISIHESVYPGYICRQNSVVHPCDMIPPTTKNVMVALGMSEDKYIVWPEDSGARNLYVIPQSHSTYDQRDSDDNILANFLGHRLLCLVNALQKSEIGIQVLNNLISPQQKRVIHDNSIHVQQDDLNTDTEKRSFSFHRLIGGWLTQLNGEASMFQRHNRQHPVTGRTDPKVVEQLDIDVVCRKILKQLLTEEGKKKQEIKPNLYNFATWKVKQENVKNNSQFSFVRQLRRLNNVVQDWITTFFSW